MPSLNKSFLENTFNTFKSFDWFIILLVFLISIISLLVLSSLDFQDKNLVEKHSIRIAFSFLVFVIFPRLVNKLKILLLAIWVLSELFSIAL